MFSVAIDILQHLRQPFKLNYNCKFFRNYELYVHCLKEPSLNYSTTEQFTKSFEPGVTRWLPLRAQLHEVGEAAAEQIRSRSFPLMSVAESANSVYHVESLRPFISPVTLHGHIYGKITGNLLDLSHNFALIPLKWPLIT